MQPVTVLRQRLSSWGSLLHKAKRAKQRWQGTRKKHKMRRRNNKHCKNFERTREGSFSRWKSTGQISMGNSCFCKNNLNKIYICFCLILGLAAPSRWVGLVQVSVSAQSCTMELTDNILSCCMNSIHRIYVLDECRQLCLLYKQSAFFMSFFSALPILSYFFSVISLSFFLVSPDRADPIPGRRESAFNSVMNRCVLKWT